jgi:hypothetical protein
VIREHHIQKQIADRLVGPVVDDAHLRLDGSSGRSKRDVKGQHRGHRERDRDRAHQGAQHFPGIHGSSSCPVLLCRLTDAWVVLIGVGLLGSYFVGSAVSG